MVILEHIFPLLIALGTLYVAYQVWLPDFLGDKIKNVKERFKNKAAIERIAMVKLVSDDSKDIEKFISTNARYLSNNLVKQLVSRIEMIKCDSIIMEDALKTRIATIAVSEEVEAIDNTRIRRARR